jgi:chorismate mutase
MTNSTSTDSLKQAGNKKLEAIENMITTESTILELLSTFLAVYLVLLDEETEIIEETKGLINWHKQFLQELKTANSSRGLAQVAKNLDKEGLHAKFLEQLQAFWRKYLHRTLPIGLNTLLFSLSEELRTYPTQLEEFTNTVLEVALEEEQCSAKVAEEQEHKHKDKPITKRSRRANVKQAMKGVANKVTLSPRLAKRLLRFPSSPTSLFTMSLFVHLN